jgi:hypothetical protein
MISFWNSTDRLAREGLKIAWFGGAIMLLGKIFPDCKWLFWFGAGSTLTGLILQQRGAHLKKIDASPRMLTNEIKKDLLHALRNIPKQPLGVYYFGQDTEAKQYAVQIKEMFETAGFSVECFSGFLIFEARFGLSVAVYNGGQGDATATRIRDVFSVAGLDVLLETNPNRMKPVIQFAVHQKPQRVN